jgi:hypothetical protein
MVSDASVNLKGVQRRHLSTLPRVSSRVAEASLLEQLTYHTISGLLFAGRDEVIQIIY